jgi:hypothetical protein
MARIGASAYLRRMITVIEVADALHVPDDEESFVVWPGVTGVMFGSRGGLRSELLTPNARYAADDWDMAIRAASAKAIPGRDATIYVVGRKDA